jgi:hypothetical protein
LENKFKIRNQMKNDIKTTMQGLQRFTESEIKIDELFDLPVITIDDYKALSLTEREDFNTLMIAKINALKGDERDKFLIKVELLLSPGTKNQLWENNHLLITNAISTLMQNSGCMPTKNHIAEQTGLSRTTINKHLKEYTTHPQYLVEIEQYRFMTSKVLAKVFKFAVNGDIRAAKLYFEMVGNLSAQPGSGTLIQQQNNYIQINGTVLSQESIKQLSPEQLAQIEGIIKLALPKTVN